MKLYKISQEKALGYDTYDSAVVCAEDEDDAKTIHPNGNDIVRDTFTDERGGWFKPHPDDRYRYKDWALLQDIIVEYLGEASPYIRRGVVVASFNAS